MAEGVFLVCGAESDGENLSGLAGLSGLSGLFRSSN